MQNIVLKNKAFFCWQVVIYKVGDLSDTLNWAVWEFWGSQNDYHFLHCSVYELQPPKKHQQVGGGGKFLQNFTSSRDEPVRSMETRQGRKQERRLPYYRTTVEKKDKNTTVHLFCTSVVFLCVFIPALFLYFYRFIPTWNQVLQKLFPQHVHVV